MPRISGHRRYESRRQPSGAFCQLAPYAAVFHHGQRPAREARFIKKPNGSPDGVHDLFHYRGRSDTPSGCNLNQENFSNLSNLSYRIPTPTFGLALVEAGSDAARETNRMKTASRRSVWVSAVISTAAALTAASRDSAGKRRTNRCTGSLAQHTTWRWAAPTWSFRNESDNPPNCSPAPSPNDNFNLSSAGTAEFDDVTALAGFMRFFAPPARGTIDNRVTQGSNQSVNIGCPLCHSVTLVAGPSALGPAMSNQTIHPHSDFASRYMGPGLADQISQRLAAGAEFRTAPLWGLSQRLSFRHDGRETDLLKVYASSGNSEFQASEANQVVHNFNSLSTRDKQAILNFLRSL